MDLGKVSEEYFKELCDNLSWKTLKIDECTTPTPDFEIKANSGIFYAEVTHAEYEFELGKAVSINVGQTVRKKIDQKRKKKQLRDKSAPTLLVLTGASWEMGFESMQAAMYGDLTLEIGTKSGKVLNRYCDKNDKFQQNRNTSFSAIAYLTRTLTSKDQIFKDNADTLPHITIYHNMYAKHPFKRDFFENNDQLHQYWFELENTGT